MDKKLFEELSISDEIRLEAENLAKVILADTKLNVNIIKKDGFENVLKNTFDIELFGVKYEITYYIFNINNRGEINIKLFKNLIPITKNQKNEIEFCLLFINNVPDNEYFYGELYHELTHVFQYIKSKKDILENKKIDKLYTLINKIRLYNANNINMLFANAIYGCFEFEQDALIHETYGQFMRSDNIYHLDSDIEEYSNAYKFIEDIYLAIENIQKLDETLFANTQRYYLKYFKDKLNRFENKLKHVKKKIKKDFYEKHLNEGIPGNFRAWSVILKEDGEEIRNYIDNEVF